MKCQEGLIYDKNLRSCAIPGDHWECNIENDEDNENEFEQDETNVYGIDNLDVLQDEPETPSDEDFIEVIGENLDQSISRNDNDVEINEESKWDEEGLLETIDGPEARIDNLSDDEPFESSGDGVVLDQHHSDGVVTPPSPTVRMITTQIQRLTQLVKHVQDKSNGVIDDDDVTPEDLNSFLATQKVQSDSLEYQKTGFHSSDKTPMPSNGRINPEILSDILDQQKQLHHLTTTSMDATTQRYPQRRPAIYVNKEPITEIKMKSAQNLDGSGSHQIVVNRPEGSVLFNVPPPSDQSHQPYLSQDILKTILEISKQMVTHNHQKQNPQVSYAPQPFYYAVPVPYLSPQNNVQSSNNQNYQNNLTESPVQKKASVEIIPSPSTKLAETIKEELPGYVADYFQNRNPNKPYHDQPQQQYQLQASQSSFQNPTYYYQNQPSYSNGYPNYQNYQPNKYQYPTKNQYTDPLSYQQFNIDGGYYDRTRPFVMESSAPSYVEQPIRQQPIQKESYMTYDEEKIDENLYDEAENDDLPMWPEKEELICSFVMQRQANKTDCYRYYVCNAKTRETLQYTCPIFTAFNDQTKYCDALSYPSCKKTKAHSISTLHDKKIINQANKALEKVKMERQKAERIAQRVREESQKIYTQINPYQDYQQSYVHNQLPAYYPPSFAQLQKVKKPYVRQQPQHVAAIPLESYASSKPIKKSSKTKRKKVKCRAIGNIVDPESSTSYWHCFKGPDGRMKRINKKCSENLVFCPTSRYCSPEDRC